MKIYTIGFTKKTARQFFEMLRASGAKRVVDIRLHNVSQLAGFAKRDDLAYFLRVICRMEYVHEPRLAPTEEILDAYKKKKGDWKVYEREFVPLLQERKIEEIISKEIIADGVLLCSEETPEHCHRRLVAEYLRDQWGDVEIVHLV